MAKYNLGCGAVPLLGYINIDDLSDYHGSLEELQHHVDEMFEPKAIPDLRTWAEAGQFVAMDVKNISTFILDGSADEIYSERFIGRDYFDSKEDFEVIYRKLKRGGKLVIKSAILELISLKTIFDIFGGYKIELQDRSFGETLVDIEAVKS